MFYFSEYKNFIARFHSDAKCPHCGKRSKQRATKIAKEQTLLCPYCKSLFVIHR